MKRQSKITNKAQISVKLDAYTNECLQLLALMNRTTKSKVIADYLYQATLQCRLKYPQLEQIQTAVKELEAVINIED